MGEEDGGVAVGDGERARGRGPEVEERERGAGGEERDGVAGEAEDEVGGAVLVALDLVGEVQLARRPHGGRGLGFLGGKREGDAKDFSRLDGLGLGVVCKQQSRAEQSRVTAAAGEAGKRRRRRRRRRKGEEEEDPGGDWLVLGHQKDNGSFDMGLIVGCTRSWAEIGIISTSPTRYKLYYSDEETLTLQSMNVEVQISFRE